jgi:penicillin amidase
MRTDFYPGLALHGQVEILVDPWGIPHIYAGHDEDAFFAQGFNAARDRLWQLDLWRRQGLGLLSEVLGAGYLARDRAARLFLYRGPMEQEWAAYGCDLKAVLQPFADGINAYIGLTEEKPELLPAEFGALGYRPARWQPEDILRIRAHGRYRNVGSEVQRALVVHALGPQADAGRVRLEPETELTVADGLDLSLITSGILRDYELATGPVDFALASPPPPVSPPPLASAPPSSAGGSNNWVISGERTASGRPILASDPHRALSVPSLRYLVHVSGPGFDVIGGGEPIIPGISLGHNGQVAFGLTIFPVDQEDLYIYETGTGNSPRYRYRDDWEPMEIVSEVIPVRGTEPVSVELKFTRHGPVIGEDAERRAAFAVRAAWLETGMAPYLASIALMAARDWPSFRAAAEHWKSPGENLIYADTGNNIGWQPAALVPVRPNWNGLLPVPGDGRYEWAGFVTAPDLPAELNPPRGWIATANQRNADASQAGGVQVGFEWEPPFRFQRICEVLDSAQAATVPDSENLQNDFVSLPARPLCALVSELTCADPRAARAVSLLASWDQRIDASSAGAALFEVWLRSHLRPALLTLTLAPSVPPDLLAAVPDLLAAVPDLLANPANRTGDARIDLALLEQASSTPAGKAEVASMLEQTLAAAMRHLEELLGPDPEAWTWGALHTADLVHPLTRAGRLAGADLPAGLGPLAGADPLAGLGPLAGTDPLARVGPLAGTDPLARLGPQAKGGSGDTVGSAPYGAASFTQNSGASLRLVLDVGGWDNSVAMNSPGQSGDLASPHYADLYQAWARGENVPLLYTRERIEAVAEHRLVLQP